MQHTLQPYSHVSYVTISITRKHSLLTNFHIQTHIGLTTFTVQTLSACPESYYHYYYSGAVIAQELWGALPHHHGVIFICSPKPKNMNSI